VKWRAIKTVSCHNYGKALRHSGEAVEIQYSTVRAPYSIQYPRIFYLSPHPETYGRPIDTKGPPSA
jgi:hypothetical protein